MDTAFNSKEFFCLDCNVTAELDGHGRCATCGSGGVTHPDSYTLGSLPLGDWCIREKRLPTGFRFKDGQQNVPQSVFTRLWQEIVTTFRKPMLIPSKRRKEA